MRVWLRALDVNILPCRSACEMMCKMVCECSGGGGRVLHLLGSVPHAAFDLGLLQPGWHPAAWCRQQGAAGRPVLRIRDPLLRQLRHQPDTLQHHVAQVPARLQDDSLPRCMLGMLLLLPPRCWRPVPSPGKYFHDIHRTEKTRLFAAINEL